MTGLSRDHEIKKQADEEALLETVLHGSDRLLRDSLREDDRRRRVRRRIVVSLIGGVLVMGTFLIAALAGWLTLFTPPPVSQADVDKEVWVKRIVGLTDHMQTAFGVGPELTQLEPDHGVAIVREAWPKVKEFQVKTGLLKAFEFSKALPAKHAKVLQVLDLGMHDKDPKVRDYAASYVEEYAGKNFASDPKGYATWYAANRDKDPNELLKLAKSNAKPDAKAAQDGNDTPAGKAGPINTVALNTKGWKLFFSGDYESAEKIFRQILAKHPDYPPSMNGLGFCLLNQGQVDEAKPYFEKLLKKDPNGAGYLNGMARCLKEEGKIDEAIAVWEKMVKHSPGVNAGTTGLATSYLEKKEYAKAIPYFEQLVKAEPDNQEFKDGLEAAKKGIESKSK
jgi:pentatricopeptide repeat protein